MATALSLASPPAASAYSFKKGFLQTAAPSGNASSSTKRDGFGSSFGDILLVSAFAGLVIAVGAGT
jgi:hypothetical protein